MDALSHMDHGYSYPYPASRYPYHYIVPRYSASQSSHCQLPDERSEMGEEFCAPLPELSEAPADLYPEHPHETPEMSEVLCAPFPALPETPVNLHPVHPRSTEPTAQLPSPPLSPIPAPIRPKRGRPPKYKRDENGRPIKADENQTPVPRGKYCIAGKEKGKGKAKTGNGKRKTTGKTGPARTPAKQGRRYSAQSESRCTLFCICKKLRREGRGGRDKDDDDDKGRDRDRDKRNGKHKAEAEPKYEQLEPKYTDAEYKALADRIVALLWQGQTPRFDLVVLAREAPNRRFTRLETYVRELFDDPIMIIRLEAGIDKPRVRPVGPDNAGWTKRYPEPMEGSDEWGLETLWRGEDGEL